MSELGDKGEHWTAGEAYKGLENIDRLAGYENITDVVKFAIERKQEAAPPLNRPTSFDEWSKVATENMGLPEKVDNYIPSYKNETSEFFKESKDDLVKTLHEAKVPPVILDKVLEGVTGVADKYGKAGTDSKEAEVSQRMEQYKKQFKTDADLQDHFAQATKAYESLVGEEVREQIKKDGLNKYPEIVEVFSKLANYMKEDKILKDTSLGGAGESLDELNAQIEATSMDVLSAQERQDFGELQKKNAELDRLQKKKYSLQERLDAIKKPASL